MDFLATFIIFGPLFAGPGDSSGLPLIRTTHYEARSGIMDVQERWEEFGPRRVRVRRGIIPEGRTEPPEWDAQYFDLNTDGTIHGIDMDSSGDFHQNGFEYFYASGHLAKMVTWYHGIAEDSSVMTYQDGRLIGASHGFAVVWSDGRIQSQGDASRTDTFVYSAAGDSIRVQIQDLQGEPNQKTLVYRLENGRLVSQAEFDSLGIISSTTYRYGSSAVLRPFRQAGARIAPDRIAGSVDALGRRGVLGATVASGFSLLTR